MKNIIYLILILSANILVAQQYPVLTTTSLANYEDRFKHGASGNYAIDTANERQHYLGLWEYNQNGILFQVKIELATKAILILSNEFQTTYSYMDEVIVKYRLVKNGTELFNNLNQTNITNEISYGFKLAHEDFLGGRMKDFTRNVYGSFKIKRELDIPPKIIFEMILGNYTKLNPDSFYQDAQPLFSIPLGPMEMVKVN